MKLNPNQRKDETTRGCEGIPVGRFFCASGKPLKRFLKHTPLNTRLKPGVNEKGVTAKRTEVRAPWAGFVPINSLRPCTFASLR